MQVEAVGEGGEGRQGIAREVEILELFHLCECTVWMWVCERGGEGEGVCVCVCVCVWLCVYLGRILSKLL